MRTRFLYLSLDDAVVAKVDGIIAFCWWWFEKVQRPGGDRQSINAVQNYCLSVAEAEEFTGVRQPQVSRWHKVLGWALNEDETAADLRLRRRFKRLVCAGCGERLVAARRDARVSGPIAGNRNAGLLGVISSA